MGHFSGIKEKDYHYVSNNLEDVEDFAWWLHIHNPELLKQIVSELKNKKERDN